MQRRVRASGTRHDALDREPAAEAAGAARVGHEAVALDHDRELGLGHLDRDVRPGRARVREPVVAVARPAGRPTCRRRARSRRSARRRRRWPVKIASVLPPSPAAGTRSGISCASAPFIASKIRKPVTPRIDDAPGMTTCVTVPGFVITLIGRNAPAVLGISTVERRAHRLVDARLRRTTACS